MSSKPISDAFDLERDLPTTAEDVRMLARASRRGASWLLDGRVPFDVRLVTAALKRRPTARADWPPFTLAGD